MNGNVRSVIEVMKDNLNRKLSLAEMCRSADLSISRLSHLFRKEVGESPAQYLIMLKMERARSLLCDPVQSVKAVMVEVGFRDQSNFARAFKKAYGETPSEYRAKKTDSASVPSSGKLIGK